MRLRRRETAPEDFQMAPMIDMVFLLLVFFMCVSSLARADRALPVELPESRESKVPEETRNRATVTVLADGRIAIGADTMDAVELDRRLRAALAGNAALRFEVRADRDVPFGEVKKILRTCAEAGAYEIIYATHQAN